MCGRFALTTDADTLQQQFHVAAVAPVTPRYNIAPTQEIIAICQNGDGYRHVKTLRWGLVPPWANDSTIGARMINARSETVHEKPSFRQPIRYHRCLIPASGFIEWLRQPDGSKQPYYIQRKDGELLAMAGIWDTWKGSEQIIESCSILTTHANNLIATLHDRMPVLLSPSEYDQWLDRNINDPQQLMGMYTPYPSETLRAMPISPLINNPRHDSPDCLASVS